MVLLNFCDGHQILEKTPEEGWRAYQPKLSAYKGEDNILNTLHKVLVVLLLW